MLCEGVVEGDVEPDGVWAPVREGVCVPLRVTEGLDVIVREDDVEGEAVTDGVRD